MNAGGGRLFDGRPFGGACRRSRADSSATRDAIGALAAEPDAVFVLKVKEQQFQDAINTALGLDFAAIAQPAGVPEPTGLFAVVRAATDDAGARARDRRSRCGPS